MAGNRILIVLSEWGFWGEELIGPLERFDAAHYETTILTPKGRRPLALPASKDATFVDPPLGKPVVSPEMARKTAAIDDPSNPRLCSPINLSDWFPKNPYASSASYLREREAYFKALEQRKREINDHYDAVLVVGGSGAMSDLSNNYRLKDLLRCFFELGKPIAAQCYGVACLAFTCFSEDDGRPIIWGKCVAGHPRLYDYQEGWGCWDRDRLKPDGTKGDWIVTDFPAIPLQLVLELAVGPQGRFYGNVGKETSVIVDYPFVTGRSTADGYLTGQKIVEVLETGLRRWGW